MAYGYTSQLGFGGEHLLFDRGPVLKVQITVRLCTFGLLACLLVGVVHVLRRLIVAIYVLVVQVNLQCCLAEGGFWQKKAVEVVGMHT